MRYAHVHDGQVLRTVDRDDETDLPDPTLEPDGVERPGATWLPVVAVIDDHDPATHRPTGAVYTVEADRVVAHHAAIEIVEDDDEPAVDD